MRHKGVSAVCACCILSGTKLTRGCWCRQSPKTCPVHVAGPYLDSHGEGERLFAGVTADNALRVLRRLLAVLKVEDAGERQHCNVGNFGAHSNATLQVNIALMIFAVVMPRTC